MSAVRRTLAPATFALAIVSALLGACVRDHTDALDDAALRAADADSAEWLSYGRTYTEQRHSPLAQIDEASVALYRDRVYVGTIDGRLVALDTRTGAPVWSVQTTPKGGPYAIRSRRLSTRWRRRPRSSPKAAGSGSNTAAAATTPTLAS